MEKRKRKVPFSSTKARSNIPQVLHSGDKQFAATTFFHSTRCPNNKQQKAIYCESSHAGETQLAETMLHYLQLCHP